jgi:hypothetical protein
VINTIFPELVNDKTPIITAAHLGERVYTHSIPLEVKAIPVKSATGKWIGTY